MTNTATKILGSYLVSLTRVRDGVTVVWKEDFDVHADSDVWFKEPNSWKETTRFLWEDGNYSCNCNRFLFFERALGKTEAEIDALDPSKEESYGDCGKYEKYRCNWIKDAHSDEMIYRGEECSDLN